MKPPAPAAPQDESADAIAQDPWSGPSFLRLSILGAWAMYLANIAFRLLLFPSSRTPELFARHLATAAIGAGLTAILYRVLKRVQDASLARRIGVALVACAPAALLLSYINYEMVFVIGADRVWTRLELSTYSLRGTMAATVSEFYFVLMAWSILYMAVTGAAQFQTVKQAAVAAQAQARESQLRALRYQLNPHLIFNVLNSISALVLKKETDGAEAAIASLSAFLRSTLDVDATQDITLDEELRLQHLYLAVEQLRFANRLSVVVSVAEEARTASVPALILQPLIENAVHHGVSRTSRRVLLNISASVQGPDLCLTVRDDGRAPPRETTSGLGLRNVEARLALRFGEGATCTYGPQPGGGFEVCLRLPFKPNPATAADS